MTVSEIEWTPSTRVDFDGSIIEVEYPVKPAIMVEGGRFRQLLKDLGFSAKVALLIGHHVNAKRYLAGKKKEYFERLSAASKKTLFFQGGVMLEEEMVLFEKNIHFKDILRVRVNDEKAKEMDIEIPDLTYYRPYLYRHFEETERTTESIMLPDYVDDKWVEQFKAFLESECYEKASMLG